MPCGLPADDAIPLAQYGRSNLGRAKTIYRNGLTYRSGAHRIGTRILLKPVGEQELLRAISKALTSR
jgi:hypothetical protein